MTFHRFVVGVWSAVSLVGLCFMLSLLVGCAGVIARSEVPVAVRCVDQLPTKPVYRTKTLPADASDAEKVRAIALDWLDSRPYEAELEAGLEACR